MLDRPNTSALSLSSVDTAHFFESYRLYRNYCEHENSLIYQRISALLTIQAFLFGLSGYLLDKSQPSMDTHYLLVLMAWVGLLASVASLLAIVAAWSAQTALIDSWTQNRQINPEMRDAYPHLSGGGSIVADLFGRSLILFPALSIFVWWYWIHVLRTPASPT